MEIRQAQESDIPAIVSLLKLSLGETLMPKSEAFWRWKHIDNPFGKSPVLLAFEGKLLVGVRAFMRWEWRQGEKVYKAVRAVDTATHPEYQGKGIFKKLTLELVQQCQREEVDFIFNTPNTSSKPGYLKMGWDELGKLNINFRPAVKLLTKISPDFAELFCWNSRSIETVQVRSAADFLITNYKSGFFNWRYGSNPNIKYYLACNEQKGLFLIFRLKPHWLGNEFRVVDLVMADGATIEELHDVIWDAVGKSGARLVTIAGAYKPVNFLTMRIGPVVTQRLISMDKHLSFNFWKPSLGDIEVF